MNTYRIKYTRHDPVYGRGWKISYYRPITAKRNIKAATPEEAKDVLVKVMGSERPDSKVEIKEVMQCETVRS